MQTMRFSERQENVTVYELEDGRDILICLNEREIKEENPVEDMDGEKNGVTSYEYDGNIFRTHSVTEEEVRENPEKYLDYPGDEAPTEEMSEYANKMIDEYTAQLMEEGII